MPGFDPEKAKYLCNPANMRVMVNTPDKRRVCPDLIPCNKLDASDIAKDPRIFKAKEEKFLPQPEEADNQDGSSSGSDVDVGFDALRLQIKTSEDKDELCKIAGNLALELRKVMKVSTMQTRLLEHIDKLEAKT